MATRSSTRSNGRGSIRGGRSRRNQFGTSGQSDYHSNGTSRDRDDIRRLCREFNLCFECRRAGHQSNQCSNASSRS